MTLHDDDINRILENLTRNDHQVGGLNQKAERMNSFQQDGLLSDSWVASDDLLENMFSLEQSSLSFLEDDVELPDVAPGAAPTAPAAGPGSSSSSDSGLSSDHADFDFEQELSPFLIQNSCDEGPASPGRGRDVIVPDSAESTSSSDAQDDAFDMLDFEQNVMPGFLNKTTFQSPGKTRKRRLSQTPQAAVQPKLQKATVSAASSAPAAPKPQLVVRAQPQQPVKLANIQVLGSQTKVYSKPVESVAPQRRVIRVAPMAGNPRSILLPVTIKDMKDLKSIKIINAAELKHAPGLQLAAASLLSHSRRERRPEPAPDCGPASAADESDSDPGPEPAGYPRLQLSPEERRLLAKEGVRLPPRYPLTKHEERELKRIRRKIRNKLSAQDSRKRKKEYVDGLEDRVKQCTAENQTLIRRIKILQSQNHSLTAQLKRLQKVLTGASGGARAQPATCLMVLLLSVALVALPSLRDPPAPGTSPARPHTPPALTRALLSATKLADETVIDDGEFMMEEPLALAADELEYRRPAARHYVDLPLDDRPPAKFGPPLVTDDHYGLLRELGAPDVGGKPAEPGGALPGLPALLGELGRLARRWAAPARRDGLNGSDVGGYVMESVADA